MTPRRVHAAIGAAALPPALRAPAHQAAALTYPANPITLIMPWPAGGSTDVALRAPEHEIIKQSMSYEKEALGKFALAK